MARGVAREFLGLLQGDSRHARSRAVLLTVFAALLLAPAILLWMPWGIGVHVAAVLLGIGLGWWSGLRAVDGYESSLRGMWNHWMKLAPACETVPELHRKVRGRSSHNRSMALAALLTLLWGLEVILVVVAFGGERDPMFSIPIISVNGLLVGALLGHHLQVRTWTRTFHRSLDEMVRDGELGVWGSV